MNKIVANYDSLRYCQCDIGRNQNEEQTEQPISCKQLMELDGREGEELGVLDRKRRQ